VVEAVVLGSVLFHLAIAGCYVGTRWRCSRVRRGGPRHPPVGPEELSAFELGMLAGGRHRLGEVALAELYLTGRAAARGPGTVARVAEGADPAPLSPAPFTRLLDARLPADGAVAADDLLRAASRGEGVAAALWRLRRWGLVFPERRMRRVLAVRRAAWRAQAVAGGGGVLFGAAATVHAAGVPGGRFGLLPLLSCALLLAYPFLLRAAHTAVGGVPGAVAAAFVVTTTLSAARTAAAPPGAVPVEAVAAPALFAGWFALLGVYRATGGELGARTAAGDAVLAEARARPGGSGPVDAALRAAALLGFRALRRRPRGGVGLPLCAEFGWLRSFAAACGRGVGGPDVGPLSPGGGVARPRPSGGRGGTPTAEPHHPSRD
jgi:uncharacterized protein (TIGR04222 family)